MSKGDIPESFPRLVGTFSCCPLRLRRTTKYPQPNPPYEQSLGCRLYYAQDNLRQKSVRIALLLAVTLAAQSIKIFGTLSRSYPTKPFSRALARVNSAKIQLDKRNQRSPCLLSFLHLLSEFSHRDPLRFFERPPHIKKRQYCDTHLREKKNKLFMPAPHREKAAGGDKHSDYSTIWDCLLIP